MKKAKEVIAEAAKPTGDAETDKAMADEAKAAQEKA